MSEHRYDVRIPESCVDPNPWKVERQDPDNFTCFQTRKMCAWEIAAYVFKVAFNPYKGIYLSKTLTCMKFFLFKQKLFFFIKETESKSFWKIYPFCGKL